MPRKGTPETVTKPSTVPAGQMTARQKSVYDKYNFDEVDKVLFSILTRHPAASVLELAALVNMSRGAVRVRIKRPAFTKAMEEFNGTLEDHLKRVKLSAARRLAELVRSKDEKIALEACKFILATAIDPDTGRARGGTLPAGTSAGQARAIVFQTFIGDNGGLLRNQTVITGIDEVAEDTERERATMAQILDVEASETTGGSDGDGEDADQEKND